MRAHISTARIKPNLLSPTSQNCEIFCVRWLGAGCEMCPGAYTLSSTHRPCLARLMTAPSPTTRAHPNYSLSPACTFNAFTIETFCHRRVAQLMFAFFCDE